ncbi:hypothetical protein VCHA53O466_50521 [Vibrio chagasii]|nr:hypothetical protein VCHA53O466_50521 [Vibrio chagasii]
MFVGENSLIGKRQILRAKDMLESGSSMDDIYQSIQCFVGADGKWRHEISDHEMKFTDEFRRAANNVRGEATIRSIIYDVLEDGKYNVFAMGDNNFSHGVRMEGVDLDFIEEHFEGDVASSIQNLEGRVSKDNSRFLSVESKYTPSEVIEPLCLMDAIVHQELLEGYHQFWNVFIDFNHTSDGASYLLVEDEDRQLLGERLHPACDHLITLGSSQHKEHLIHEVQHSVQRMEGFAIGGNSSLFKGVELDSQRLKLEKLQQELKSITSSDSAFDGLVNEVEVTFLGLCQDYPNGKGSCDWLNVPKELSARYFQLLEEMKGFGELNERYQAANNDLAFTLRRGRSNALTPYEQYRLLAGEKEAFSAHERTELTKEERALEPPLTGRDGSIIFFNSDERISYLTMRDIDTISHYTSPKFKLFSTAFAQNVSLPSDLLVYVSNAFIEIYADLADELPKDNELSKDYNRIMALLRVSPEEFKCMGLAERDQVAKEFSNMFLSYTVNSNPPTKLEGVIGNLRQWVDAAYRGNDNSPVKYASSDEMFKSMFSETIGVDGQSDFQSKLVSQIRNSTEQTPKAAASVAALIDSMMESVSERSGLGRAELNERYDINIKPHIGEKIRL